MSKDYPIKSDVISLRDVLSYRFIIPAYQRPYEWNEANIDSLLTSVLDGFKDENSGNKRVFFGTMQVAENRDQDNVFDIVDGHQRITTFLLLLNVIRELQEKEYTYLDIIEKHPIKAVLGIECDSEWLKDYNLQKYIENLNLIRRKVKDHYKDDVDKGDLISFESYLLDNIYVVFLITEKELPLSDVVTVFNTINTTGLDLNASDVFKFRYYDFLCKYHPDHSKWMERINECYLYVERSNDTTCVRIEMSWILSVYKHVICSAFDMPYSEFAKSNMAFFDDLFSDNRYKERLCDPVLSFETFDFLVKMFVDYYRWIEKTTKESNVYEKPYELFSPQIIDWTRYSKYWTIPYVAAFFSLGNTSKIDSKERTQIYASALKLELSFLKLFIIYSVIYAKAINQVHNRVCRYLRKLKNNGYDSICNEIENLMWMRWIDEKTEKDDRNEKWEKDEFYGSITSNLYDNGLRVNLVCMLSSLIDEVNANTPINEIYDKIFRRDKDHEYDIEHIWARNLFQNDQSLSEDKKRVLNGIGNLVILDRDINRKIKDSDAKIKREAYINSKYQSVNNVRTLLENNPWNYVTVDKRKEAEIQKIKLFLGDDD